MIRTPISCRLFSEIDTDFRFLTAFPALEFPETVRQPPARVGLRSEILRGRVLIFGRFTMSISASLQSRKFPRIGKVGITEVYIPCMAKSRTLDPIAQDCVAWCIYAEMDYRVARTLFNSGDAMLYFAAMTIGHHAVELYLKGALIKLGMKACDPKKATAFGIQTKDCVWGHGLYDLGVVLATRSPAFTLSVAIDVSGLPVVDAPTTIGEGLRFFDPYFSELRYPQKITRGGVSKDHGIILDAIVKELRPFLAAVPTNYLA
jgi:hypothetical protein